MQLWERFVLAVGLSMDASFAVRPLVSVRSYNQTAQSP